MAMKRTRSTNSREPLLDAAEDVVIERGVNDMTLAAVAARAGVSKGGLLYHFPSKDALIRAMVARIASFVETRFAEELAAEPPGAGRHARALLRFMMSNKRPMFNRLRRVAAPLLASMSSNPRLLDPMRAFFNRVRRGMLEDGMPADRAWLILAALDGLKFWRIFNLLEPSQGDLAGLQRLLAQIIDQSSK
jgi:AcrR family transcriptional regulator